MGVERVVHTIEPIFDSRSRVLVLGTMPSPRSREVGFYYGHPQNRFWRVMERLYNMDEGSLADDAGGRALLAPATDSRFPATGPRSSAAGPRFPATDPRSSAAGPHTEGPGLRSPAPGPHAAARDPHAARRAFLSQHGIALWDVLAACDIAGASDASISNALPNDLARVLDAAPIRTVCTTGGKAARLCRAFDGEMLDRRRIRLVELPSTSPANARMRLDDLVRTYRATGVFVD